MPSPVPTAPVQQGGLAKAELRQLDADFNAEINPDKATKVQFNPDSLKVSFANQIAQPSGSGDQNGPQARQFVGAGTTKLTVTLYFDVTAELPVDLPQANDVRKLTARVAYFITPASEGSGRSTKYIPPSVRFIWGSFVFDGIMESMEETLEIFSAEGRPLRASVAIALSQQKITEFKFSSGVKDPPAVTRRGGAPPGTAPMTEAPAGSNLQSMAANQPGGSGGGLGINGGWQAIAAANGIENPRLLDPGQLIDLNPPSLSASIGVDAGVSASVDISAGAQIG
jgi:Contractile injection system tube protein